MSTADRDLARKRNRDLPAADSTEVAAGRTTRTDSLVGPGPVLTSGIVQRKAERDENGVAPGAGDAVAKAAGGTGQALPENLMRKFEDSLGADLSGVRVHTGGDSQTAAHATGAKAYTTGSDIHFGAGQYDPGSHAGELLLAHEVAHTVQQSGGAARKKGPQFKLDVSSPTDGFEVEADRAADAMVAGRSANVAGGPSGGVHRKDDKAGAKDDDGDNEKSKFSPSWGSAAKGLLLHGDVGMEFGPNEALNKQIKAEYKTDPWEKHIDIPVPAIPGLYARFGAEAGASLEGGVTPNAQVGQFTEKDGSKKRTMAATAAVGMKAEAFGMVKGGLAAGVPGLKIAGMVGGKITGTCSIAGEFGVDVTSTKAKGAKTWTPFAGHMTFKLPIELGLKLTAEAFGEYEILWKTGKLGNLKLGEYPLCLISGSIDIVIPMNGGAATCTNTIKYEGVGAKPEAKAELNGPPEVKKDAEKAGVKIKEASPEQEAAAQQSMPADAAPPAPNASMPEPNSSSAATPAPAPAPAPAPDGPNASMPEPNHS